MDGLLDFAASPAGQGLLGAVFSGLAGARRGAPMNSLGAAGAGGLLAYNQAQQSQAEAANDMQRSKFYDMQIQQMQELQAQQKAAQEALRSRQGYLGSLGQVTSPRVDAQPNQFDPMAWIRMGGSPEEAKILAGSKDWGRSKVARTIDGTDAQGNPVTLQYDEFGNPVGSGVGKYIAPVQVNQGNKISFVTPRNGVSLGVGMSPEGSAANARGWAGLKLQRDQIEQGGKAPVGYRYKPDGSMEAIPGGPADAKAQAAAQLKAGGATDVDVAISTLRDAYDRLEKGGGITSTKNGALGNAAAWASSSSLGQGVGKALGTDNQSARNDISMARPALLAAMMKATGMSAKQMDSNAELKLWLSTATDPTLDIESNRRALANIERKYLGGASIQEATPAPADKSSGGLSPAEQAELQQLRKRFGG